MKKNLFKLMCAVCAVAAMCVTFTSCSDDPEPTVDNTTLLLLQQLQEQQKQQSSSVVTITNNSTNDLYRFTVHFVNAYGEELTAPDYGTLYAGSSVSAEIPTGAEKYYMATYLYGTWYFSPDYAISYKSLTLSSAEVGRWRANSSASRYPMASSEN